MSIGVGINLGPKRRIEARELEIGKFERLKNNWRGVSGKQETSEEIETER